MAVQFLSEQWARELGDRLNADPEFVQAIGSQDVKILQVINGKDGPLEYWLTLAGGKVGLGLGPIEAPDATIIQDYVTAVGLAKSEINPVTAFMTGKIKIAGNMMVLLGLQNAFAQLPAVMAEMDIEY